MAAHVAASGLDPHRYLTATCPTDRLVLEAVAAEARQMRKHDLAEVLGAVL